MVDLMVSGMCIVAFQEVESYIEHIQSLFEEKVSRVQFDNRALRRELDQRGGSTDGQVAHIRRLLQQHCGVGGNSVSGSTACGTTTNATSNCHNGSSAGSNDTGSSSTSGTGTAQLLRHHDNNPKSSLLNSAPLSDQMTLVEQVTASFLTDHSARIGLFLLGYDILVISCYAYIQAFEINSHTLD